MISPVKVCAVHKEIICDHLMQAARLKIDIQFEAWESG
jgi:hypothetical protein